MNNFELVYTEYIEKGKSTYKLAEEWQLPKSTVYQITKVHGLVGIKQADKINTCDETKFDIADPIFCYLSGLIAADGYIDTANHRVVLRLKYECWVETLNKLREYFRVSNTVKEYSGNGGYKMEYRMADLTISSQKLIDELSRLNIIGRKKDLGVRFPNMGIISDECQEMFIRGLLDGDGSIRGNRGGISILEESILMMEAIRDYFNSKFSLSYRLKDSDKGFKYLYIWKEDSESILSWLYRHNLEIKLEYKYLRALG